MLAWVRTGLALAAVSLLLTRLTPDTGTTALVAALGGLLMATAIMTLQSSRHVRGVARLRRGAFRPGVLAAAGLTSTTVGLAAVALALVATGQQP